MKTFPLFLTALVCGWMCGCTPLNQNQPGNNQGLNVVALEILPHPDTLNMVTNNSQTFNLRGTSIDTSQQTMTNSGVITDASFTVVTTDTTTTPFPSDGATWSSSNTVVATVSNGIVIAHNPGYANITASVGTVSAVPVLVSVKGVNTAPGLSLDPPLVSMTFRDTIAVTGNVQQQATLNITESSSGHNNPNVPYDVNGNFSETIIGLVPGYRTMVATAQNPNQPSLATTRYKYVYYYQYLSPAADSICGNWLGTTLGMNFNFTISKSIIYSRYDINGHIDIQFQGIGVVKDIVLTGIVNRDGTIDASLSKSDQGFTISGSLNGYFKTTGTGEGSYSTTAKKAGWPTLSATADWTAVKLP